MNKTFSKLAKILCVGALAVGMSVAAFVGCGITPRMDSFEINEEGHLIVTMTDGTTQDLGKVTGDAGADGKDGANGKDGTNGTNGKDGTNGTNGKDGADGKDGEDGKDGAGISNVWIGKAEGDEEGEDHLFVETTDGTVFDACHPENTVRPQPIESPVLEIAVWGRWIREEQFAQIFNEFKVYAESQGFGTDNLHYTYYDSGSYNSIANFTNAIVGNTLTENTTDVVFGCKDDFHTQSSSVIKESFALSQFGGVTINGNAERGLCRLTDTDIAKLFWDFCFSVEGKALLNQVGAQ